MSMTDLTPGRLKKARIGVSLLFLANGAMWANLVPRLPEIRERLDVGYGTFGVAIGFGTVGGIVLGLLAAPMMRRFGSARTAAVALGFQALAVLGAAVAPSIWLFALLLFLNSALDAHTDVAQNAQGTGIQRRLGRSIINGLHAMWSAGAALGSLLGAGAIALGLSVPVHAAVSAVVLLVAAFVGWRLMLGPGTGIDREDGDATFHGEAANHGESDIVATDARSAANSATPASARVKIPRHALMTLLMLGLVSIAGAAVEDAGLTWSSSYMKDELGTSGTIAGLALAALMTMHFVGRIAGDYLVDRFGERLVTRVGGALTAVAMGIALAWPTVPGTLIGFAIAGLGVATTIPGAFASADEIPGLRPGTGITLISWMLRLSFMAGPPLVGFIGDNFSLRIGLLSVPIAGVAVVLLAGSLKGKAKPAPAAASA